MKSVDILLNLLLIITDCTLHCTLQLQTTETDEVVFKPFFLVLCGSLVAGKGHVISFVVGNYIRQTHHP